MGVRSPFRVQNFLWAFRGMFALFVEMCYNYLTSVVVVCYNGVGRRRYNAKS